MRTSLCDLMSKLAENNFKLKDPVFEGFDSLDIEESSVIVNSDEDFSADLDIMARVSVEYEGTPPESYRILNRIIQDWVEDNEVLLKKLIGPNLKKFLTDRYPNIDVSELDENFDDFIWEEQVDYFPEIDEDNKKIKFLIELVLEIEDVEEEEY